MKANQKTFALWFALVVLTIFMFRAWDIKHQKAITDFNYSKLLRAAEIKEIVDDKVVFTGTTPRSLGYVTINFNPTNGKSVKIELTGAANNRDAFGNIIEIPGTPDAQSSAGKGGGKNTLGIVEAEIYEPISR